MQSPSPREGQTWSIHTLNSTMDCYFWRGCSEDLPFLLQRTGLCSVMDPEHSTAAQNILLQSQEKLPFLGTQTRNVPSKEQHSEGFEKMLGGFQFLPVREFTLASQLAAGSGSTHPLGHGALPLRLECVPFACTSGVDL